IKREVARFLEIDRYRNRAIGDDLRFVDGESGHWIDHLVVGAEVGHRSDGVGDEGLGACADDDILRRDVEPAAYTHVARRGRAKLVDPGRRRVTVLAAMDRRD